MTIHEERGVSFTLTPTFGANHTVHTFGGSTPFILNEVEGLTTLSKVEGSEVEAQAHYKWEGD